MPSGSLRSPKQDQLSFRKFGTKNLPGPVLGVSLVALVLALLYLLFS